MGFMSFVKGLFSMPEALKGVERAADALHYSEEEKDAAEAGRQSFFLKLTDVLSNDYSPAGLARRFLAFATMGVFFFLIGLMVVWFPVEILWIYDYQPAHMAADMLKALLKDFDGFMMRYAPVTFFYLTLVRQIYTLVLMVMGTYFVYHGVLRMKKGK
jgi:hypothetical protein